jgi:hypothetical protein
MPSHQLSHSLSGIELHRYQHVCRPHGCETSWYGSLMGYWLHHQVWFGCSWREFIKAVSQTHGTCGGLVTGRAPPR